MPQKTFLADAGSGVLSYWEAGEGPPLLLLHGGPGPSDYMSLLDAAGVRRAVVLGHSWGGYLALRLAEAAPERVAGLVLVDPLGAAGPAQAPPPPAGLAPSVAGNEEAQASVAESLAGGFGDRLAAVPAPAVFVLGERSPMPLSQNQQTAVLLPDAEVVVVPEAGHLPWHERPGCVASASATIRGRAGI
jgi:pimeloyl-ACP methyl ester carboxylesterase